MFHVKHLFGDGHGEAAAARAGGRYLQGSSWNSGSGAGGLSEKGS